MTTPRIAVLNARDDVLGFLDNDRPDAIHYFDETLHLYLAGSAYTFEGKVLTSEDSQIIEVGNKLSFRYENKDYYLNIVKTEKDELYTSFECFGLTFEFLNEEVDKYEATEAKTLAAYIQQWGAETMDLRIIHNEVADRALKLKWEGRETILKRLFSLATNFDVELDFQTVLNRDFSLSHMNLYIVKQTGKDRTGEILRYGKDIEGIKKTSDVSDLYTAIRPRGKDGLTLAGYSHAKESDGCWLRGEDILNPSAKDRFPAVNPNKAEGYIARYWDCDVEDQAMLYGRALAELRKNSVPKVEYEVDGFVDGAIGDRFTIEDDAYTPTLYVEARVVEQEICFTDPSRCKTTFDNFTEVKSQLSSTIQAQVEKLVEKYKTFQAGISSTAGTTFVNGVGTTTLTAYVRDGVTDVTDKFTIRWYKAGTQCGAGKTLTVSSTDFADTAVYGFKAFGTDGSIKGEYELTFANVSDGVSDYLHIKYSNDGGQTFSTPDGDWIGQYHDSNPVDSPDPARYTWAKIKGNDGANGQTQKLVSLTNEYYLSTSDTAQTGGSWGTTYPDYVDGKFLWVRVKAVYKDPNGTAYTTPELEKAWLAAGQAINKAETALSSATAASSAAAAAVSQANAAKATADSVAAEIAPIKTGVQEAKDAAADAKKEIADKTQQMLLDIGDTYATKNEVTALEGDLQAQITANATEIASKVSETVYQQNQANIDSQLSDLNSDLTAAQGTLSSLQSSQSEAAQKLAQAEQDLKDAQDAVADLQTSQTATDSQLKAAQAAVDKAQAAVNKAQSDVDKANTEIGKVKTDIAGIQGDITDLTSRVTTAETSITQNANAIALRATKTEVNTAVQGAKDYADAQIKVSANEIKSSVEAVSDQVDGLQQQKVEYLYYLSTSPDSCTGGSWSTTKPAETAGKYIWQKIKTTYVSGASTESSPARLTGKDGAAGKDGTSVTVTGTASTYQVSSSGTTVPTGTWSSTIPATNPGQYLWTKNVTTYSNGATSTSYSVSRNGTNGADGGKGDTGPTGPQGAPGTPALHISVTPTWSGSSCTLTAHVFKGGVELTAAQITAEGQLRWYLNGSGTAAAVGTTMTRTVGVKESWEVRLESGSTIKTRASIEIENPSIGGRNLLIGSETIPANVGKWVSSYAIASGSDAGHDYFQVTIPAGAGSVGIRGDIDDTDCRTKEILDPNELYTYSFWVWVSKAASFHARSIGHMQCISSTNPGTVHLESYVKVTPSSIPANTWTFCTITFKVSARAYMLPYLWYLPEDCTFRFSNPKVEKGTVATDWTPAPEDVDSAISDLEDKTILNATALEQRLSSQILQTQEQIQQTVTEQYFTKDETNKLIQQVSTAFTQTAEGWQMDFNKLVSVVNANQAATDSEFQEWSKYIRFVDGNIILGAVANPVVLTIKNNRISFAQSGQEVAYLSNAELVITDARVTHSLIIGKFGLVPRANGSMDLKKVSS